MRLMVVVYGTRDGWEPAIEDESGMVVSASYPALPTEAQAQMVARAMLARMQTRDRLAPLGSIVLKLTDMIDALREWRPYNSRLAIAAAGLSQDKRDIEQAIRDMQEDGED